MLMTPTTDLNVRTSSRGNAAYAHLREGIVLGRYRPNQRLIEVDLSHKLGISRTPVREVLQRLHKEGLVSRVPSGWVVVEHDADQIRQIYEVRAGLEGHGARLAAERAAAESFTELDAVYEQSVEDLVAGPREPLVHLNAEFHSKIIALAGNERLSDLCNANSTFSFNYRNAQSYSDAEMAASLNTHTQILAAVKRQDGEAADLLMRQHIMSALEIVLRTAPPARSA